MTRKLKMAMILAILSPDLLSASLDGEIQRRHLWLPVNRAIRSQAPARARCLGYRRRQLHHVVRGKRPNVQVERPAGVGAALEHSVVDDTGQGLGCALGVLAGRGQIDGSRRLGLHGEFKGIGGVSGCGRYAAVVGVSREGVWGLGC
jgi:hypothetical protein